MPAPPRTTTAPTGSRTPDVHTLVSYNDIYGNGGMGYYSKMQPEGGQVRH